MTEALEPVTPLPTSVESMNRVSPKLMLPRYVANVLWAIILLTIFWLCYRQWGWGWLIPLGFFAIYFTWQMFLIPFQVRNLGWLETDNELILTEGKMFQTVTVIPYGRIQFVDVESGPIARAMGLKELKVHTASNTSKSEIAGLLADEADALRDRLAVKAREQMSGL